jgi:DNA-binding NarL/FixJ family response regulator
MRGVRPRRTPDQPPDQVILTQHDSPTLRAAAAQAGARRYFLKDDLTQLRALFASS